MAMTDNKLSLLKQLLGIPVTRRPSDRGCWSFAEGKIEIDLDRAPELSRRAGAVRLEGRGLPMRVLVIHGEDGRFHAFRNECGHGRRRLDPVPGTETIQCCSVGRATYDYGGNLLSGPDAGPVVTCTVERSRRTLFVTVICSSRVASKNARGIAESPTPRTIEA